MGSFLAWNISCAGCGNVSPSKKAWARSVLADNVRQHGTDGRRQHETSYKEEIELVRHCTDLRFQGVPMRQAYSAGKSGDWANYLEVFLGSGKLSAWASAKVREWYNEVEQEDEGRQIVVQDMLRKSKDFLWRIIVPFKGQEGVTLSYVCPRCHRCPHEDHIW